MQKYDTTTYTPIHLVSDISSDTSKRIVVPDSILVIDTVDTAPHIDTAYQYLYVREDKGFNRSKDIDRWNRNVGVPLGSPYCASFVSYCLSSVKAVYPTVRSASSRAFVVLRSVKANDILMGKVSPKKGWIIVWRKGNGWQGHTGFLIEDYKKNSFKTIEANTSSNASGSQREGDGVFIKKRSIKLTDYFRITEMTPVMIISTHKKAVLPLTYRVDDTVTTLTSN